MLKIEKVDSINSKEDAKNGEWSYWWEHKLVLPQKLTHAQSISNFTYRHAGGRSIH